MKIHHLKTVHPFFKRIAAGKKQWEVRRNDREYQRGDLLILQEWDGEKFTNDCVLARIDAIWDNDTLPGKPLKKGYVLLDITVAEWPYLDGGAE